MLKSLRGPIATLVIVTAIAVMCVSMPDAFPAGSLRLKGVAVGTGILVGFSMGGWLMKTGSEYGSDYVSSLGLMLSRFTLFFAVVAAGWLTAELMR